jgi:hypothetical protein
MLIGLWDLPGRRELLGKPMKTAHRIIFGLIVLSSATLFCGCSEDSGWTSGMSGLPLNSSGHTGESSLAPTGTDESAQ